MKQQQLREVLYKIQNTNTLIFENGDLNFKITDKFTYYFEIGRDILIEIQQYYLQLILLTYVQSAF